MPADAQVLSLLIEHGVAVVFAWAFMVQAGVPAPAVPMLVGAGVLSGSGRMHLVVALAAAMGAALGADALWYLLGRLYGTQVLGGLCRFSLDPDSLIRHAKERFAAHRMRYVVLAKFLPAANPLAAGLAGSIPIRPAHFLLYAFTGALLWAGAWIVLGYLCADLIGLLVSRAASLGTPFVTVLIGALIVYIAVKYVRRYLFLRHLRRARITPLELKRRMDAGDRVIVVDLRATLDIEKTPYRIPGAKWIPLAALQASPRRVPQDYDVVFYCAEPREATSARMAVFLASHGYRDVHPLAGGLEGWRNAGLPVDRLKPNGPGSS